MIFRKYLELEAVQIVEASLFYKGFFPDIIPHKQWHSECTWAFAIQTNPSNFPLLRNNPDRIISPVVNIFCAVNGKEYLVNVSQSSCQVFIVTFLKW